MTTEEKMTIDERYKYLRIMQKKYREARTRQEKQELLKHMEEATGLHRKYLIHKMNQGEIRRRKRSRERDKSYKQEVDAALAVIWEAQDYICAEHLKPVLMYTAEQLVKCGELRLGREAQEKLGSHQYLDDA